MTNEYQYDDLYSSKNIADVVKFYDSFNTAESLVKWMKNRPSEKMRIFEQEGDKSIIIVIPTPDVNGARATFCKGFYSDFHIIFVESSGRYFNFARSCDLGVKLALKYSPDWIVISNDDIKKIDEPAILKAELDKLQGRELKGVYIKWGDKPPMNCSIVRSTNPLLDLLYRFKGDTSRKIWALNKKFGIRYAGYVTDPKEIKGSAFITLKERFARAMLGEVRRFTLEGPFQIISYDFAKSVDGAVFDGTFINSYEDLELSYEISRQSVDYEYINFKISWEKGGTFGTDDLRWIRSLANKVYFNYKHAEELGKRSKQ
ncbi:MAG: hypothetical protein LVQ95_01570 [Candidatus Micrarchaeales archaeon]|nr:hypothetical protein [Candidatus Micrarchaeales archaeon]